MDVLVLGAGIIGLTTAYYLNRDGYNVTVIERNNDVALETSFANGAQLSYSYVAPLAGPGVMSHVPKWLLDRNSPLRFRPSLDPATLCWNVRFVKACNAAQSNQTTRELLALSFLSRDLYHEMMQQEAISFDHKRAGKLVCIAVAIPSIMPSNNWTFSVHWVASNAPCRSKNVSRWSRPCNACGIT
ncbi:FAD-dependent oxidoreductase [Advenella kashmirensis]|nr:FAD-dependent oxidoreductase [Advenella kashmirensis]